MGHLLKKVIGRPDFDLGEPVKVPEALGPVHHVPGGPSSSVPVTKEHHGAIGPVHILVIGDTHYGLLHCDMGVVCVRGGKVCEDLGAIKALPEECGMWELVDEIPRELLGQKVLGA